MNMELYIDNIFTDFLIRAKKSTYANSAIEKVDSSRVGSADYNYEEIMDIFIFLKQLEQ